MLSLTEQAHQLCGAASGDIVIDATAGNGHDTLFLAQRVGPLGQVYAFDIQESALKSTATRLTAAGMTNVRLIHDDHAHMRKWIEPQHRGCVSTVMFNLGYLPRGDKSIVTKSSSTLAAIDDAISLLHVGGRLTILAYPGHSGGFEETTAVERTVAAFPPSLLVKWYSGHVGERFSPKLLLVEKTQSDETPTPVAG